MISRVVLVVLAATFTVGLQACGTEKQGARAEETTPSATALEPAPEDLACSRIRQCGLLSDSDNDVKDCNTCARWLLRYLASEQFDWRPWMSYLDKTSCSAVNDLATEYKFFVCIDEQRNAWSRTHNQ